jgi:hypothetical protein
MRLRLQAFRSHENPSCIPRWNLLGKGVDLSSPIKLQALGRNAWGFFVVMQRVMMMGRVVTARQEKSWAVILS